MSKAYEILYDDQQRHLYDTHGMAAFDSGHGHGTDADVDLEEMLNHMFNMRDMPSGFGNAGLRNPRKGPDEEHPYQVTLEELYKGKTAKFSSKKNVICSHCKGTGGKDKAKPKECASCKGQGIIPVLGFDGRSSLTGDPGFMRGLRSVGHGLVTQETAICSSCKGSGKIFKEKDRCKKCKGERVTEARSTLEVYIPRGSKYVRRASLIYIPVDLVQRRGQDSAGGRG